MDNKALAEKANAIASKYGLRAEVPVGLNSVGVKGDQRVYLPVVILMGQFPGWELMEKLSSELTNTLDVSRVVYSLTSE